MCRYLGSWCTFTCVDALEDSNIWSKMVFWMSGAAITLNVVQKLYFTLLLQLEHPPWWWWWRELGCCYHFECIWKSLFHFVVAVKAPLMVNWWRESRQADTLQWYWKLMNLSIQPPSLVQQLAISCKRSWRLRWLPGISSNFWVDPILFSVYLQTKNPCTLFIDGFRTICTEFY